MRWADLDQLGHVNNVVYVDYLQEARVDMLRAHGRGPRALADGLVVVRHEVTYLKPLIFDFRPVSVSPSKAVAVLRSMPGVGGTGSYPNGIVHADVGELRHTWFGHGGCTRIARRATRRHYAMR